MLVSNHYCSAIILTCLIKIKQEVVPVLQPENQSTILGEWKYGISVCFVY